MTDRSNSNSSPVAIVTGGSRGIGSAICRRLAEQGYYVAINFSSSPDKAESVLKEIQDAGGSGETLGFDVAHATQVNEQIQGLTKRLGRIDLLVNNAGISADGLLLRMRDEDLDRTLNINLKGAILCTRAVLKPMMKARAGNIIQISSVVGETGNPGQAAYSAAKAGLIGFAKTAAKELASRKIRVNVITPGFIKTDMTEALTPEQKEGILRTIPLAQLGEPEDVANAVAFLASAQSRYITGQTLGVNGGMYM